VSPDWNEGLSNRRRFLRVHPSNLRSGDELRERQKRSQTAWLAKAVFRRAPFWRQEIGQEDSEAVGQWSQRKGNDESEALTEGRSTVPSFGSGSLNLSSIRTTPTVLLVSPQEPPLPGQFLSKDHLELVERAVTNEVALCAKRPGTGNDEREAKGPLDPDAFRTTHEQP
jgi:hypothetical protein